MLAAYAILVLYSVLHEAPSNIAQEIQAIQATSFEQHLVTVFTYVYISSVTLKKHKVTLSLLWKYPETNNEIAARYSTKQPVKRFVRHYLKK